MTGQGQAEVGNPVWCDKVQNGRQAQGQDRQNGKNRETRKQELETDRSKGENAGRLDERNKLTTDKQRTQV
jgi:hypothetical protein